MKDRETYQLPKGWIIVKLGDLAHFINGKSFKTEDWKISGVPIIRIQNLNNINSSYNYISIEQEIEEKYKIKKGDLLFAWSGTPGTSFGPHIWNGNEAYLNQHIYKVYTFPSVNKLFFYYTLNYLNNEFIKQSKGSAGLRHITKNQLEITECVLPSLIEQNQIVELIEAFFSELTDAEKSLQKATKLLSVYEYVILKNAFEGKLTENWRDQNKVETAFQSLSNLSKRRKLNYDKAIFNKAKLKSREINYDFEFSSHMEIPSWARAKLDKLIGISARVGWKGLKKEEYTSTGPLLLSVHSLNYGKIVRFDEAFNISDTRYDESPEIMLELNDILLCKDGAGIGKIGIVKFLPSKATINSSLLIVRGGEVFDADYLYYLFKGPEMQRLVNERISGSAIPHLFQKDIKEFILNVPPIDEQRQIVQEIESRFAIVENLRTAVIDNQSRSEILRRIILNKAFLGKLTTQGDVNYDEKKFIKKILKEKEDYFESQKQLAKSIPRPARIMEEKKSILQVLESTAEPLSAKEVWLQSKHKDDIESFYSELREIQSKIIEIKKDTESLLSLRHEN